MVIAISCICHQTLKRYPSSSSIKCRMPRFGQVEGHSIHWIRLNLFWFAASCTKEVKVGFTSINDNWDEWWRSQLGTGSSVTEHEIPCIVVSWELLNDNVWNKELDKWVSKLPIQNWDKTVGWAWTIRLKLVTVLVEGFAILMFSPQHVGRLAARMPHAHHRPLWPRDRQTDHIKIFRATVWPFAWRQLDGGACVAAASSIHNLKLPLRNNRLWATSSYHRNQLNSVDTQWKRTKYKIVEKPHIRSSFSGSVVFTSTKIRDQDKQYTRT